jgi:winged helix DNA-binding protein
LKFLTPRVIKRATTRYKLLELDERTFSRSARILTRALEGNKQLTRTEMYHTLQSANISVVGERGLHILSRLAQDGLICFSNRIGKQPAFALLEEWVAPTKSLERDEALAKLATNYFKSHGPASLQDFAWWSGLTITEARAGLEMVKTQFFQESISGRAYWFPYFSTRASSGAESSASAHLLPVYDEYTVAYKDRSAVLSAAHAPQAGNGIFSPAIVINSRIVGTWKRELTRDGVIVTTSWFGSSRNRKLSALKTAADRYAKFLETPVTLR